MSEQEKYDKIIAAIKAKASERQEDIVAYRLEKALQSLKQNEFEQLRNNRMIKHY